jgi:hypothetical protein
MLNWFYDKDKQGSKTKSSMSNEWIEHDWWNLRARGLIIYILEHSEARRVVPHI